MRFIDFIKKRKDVIEVEGEGLNSAIHCIHEFEGRAFTFKGLTEKYKGLDVDRLLERLQDELNSMAVLYRYSTHIKRYTDRNGQSQMRLKLIGKAGMMSKYNPLDIQLVVMTEANGK
ncbi:MAG: hypothetical protein GXY41_01400 [Phycisphaerae bacterium]|nr:hypothetical protein [Phycisphaerae bacterium]